MRACKEASVYGGCRAEMKWEALAGNRLEDGPQ